MPDYTDKALQTRERILSAAAELFYQNGYNATGLEKVIKAADVVKGNFYYYFKSKEELAVETLRWFRAQATERLGLNAVPADMPALQQIYDLQQKLKELVVTDGGVRGCFYGNLALELSSGSKLVRDELRQTFEGLRQLFADLLARAQQEGDVASHLDPLQTAGMMLSMMEGAILLSKTAQNPQEIDNAIEFIRNYLKA